MPRGCLWQAYHLHKTEERSQEAVAQQTVCETSIAGQLAAALHEAASGRRLQGKVEVLFLTFSTQNESVSQSKRPAITNLPGPVSEPPHRASRSTVSR